MAAVLDERHLGPLIDKDPEWRSTAVFTHEEAETIISDARIPPDRQMAYAIELLAGVHPGEGSALRWRHFASSRRLLVQQLLDPAQRAAEGLRIGTGAAHLEHGFELDSDGIRYGLQRFRCVSLHSAALHCARCAID